MLNNNQEKSEGDESAKEPDSEVMLRFPVPQSLHEEIMKYRGKMMTATGRDIPMYEALVEMLSMAVRIPMSKEATKSL